MIVQKILLPNKHVCPQKSLYIREISGTTYDINHQKLDFVLHSRCKFDTYFNAFSLTKWKRFCEFTSYGIHIVAEGNFIIQIFQTVWKNGVSQKLLFSQYFENEVYISRAISFGVSAGYIIPVISTSSGGNYTGSVVNYALGNNLENASYSVSGGFNIGAFADIRLYKNFYLKAGLEFTHYSYKNEFNKNVERRILQTSQYYLGGSTENNYKEEYTINQLEIPVLASYRIATSRISHVQLNVGPVIYYGLSAKMKLSGNTDTDPVIYQLCLFKSSILVKKIKRLNV